VRVNIYAEEMTDRVEIVRKEIDGHEFTAVRFYLELPASTWKYAVGQPVDPRHPGAMDPQTHKDEVLQIKGPFVHRPGDDDSSAVTFWGKRDLRPLLRQALALLDEHYKDAPSR
jgi:hypothetical protein